MRYLRVLTACVLVPMVMAGCAQTGANKELANWGGRSLTWCVLGGAVAGGVTGGFAGSGGGGWTAAGAAVLGAAAGAVIGEVACATPDTMMMKDSDGDGVADDKDQCPNTPQGVAVDKDGCPKYSDGDDVPDYLDRCPGTPAGIQVDQHGCPLDSDGDGVPDSIDQCANTPRGTRVDSVGCPLEGEKLAIVTNVNFDFDSARIRSDAQQKLASVLDLLKKNSGINTRIIGHTDSTGPAGYNQGLSVRRAEAVKNYLVSKGVSATRLSIAGRGEAEPLVSNKTRAGRAVNRRVEFEVVK